MGVYLTEVTFETWNSERFLKLGSALDLALADRGLAPFMPEPRIPERTFEEKLIWSMDGFVDLCERELSQEDIDAVFDWNILIPVEFDSPITLPVPSMYGDTTTVRSAHRAQEVMRSFVAKVGLPPGVPIDPTGLELTTWFDSASPLDARRQDDRTIVFYTALFLRAAEYSLRHACAISEA
ncbi:hypothetical protein [Nonomuraea sp. SYSU D8015]|uniref:hypothetical protein n=1 Tax=Nonomuraea sp. SYSU D8015 TaxID=2593644 RepID=UPI00166015C7|nr:hypothetical protein [Nonomuraea sp. SYSU D8015]